VKKLGNLKILLVSFNVELNFNHIPAFRGAMVESVGRHLTLFHNHVGDNFRYKYPLIQYKNFKKKATLLCVNEGLEEVQKFFLKKDWEIHFNYEPTKLSIMNMSINDYEVYMDNKPKFEYTLTKWLALNQENYKLYQGMDSLADKVFFLEKILIGNLLSMFKGVGITVTEDILLKISDIEKEEKVYFKGQKILSFNIVFKSNIFLPNYIGLGKGTSIGYGIVKKIIS
jgi:hypothetical protein